MTDKETILKIAQDAKEYAAANALELAAEIKDWHNCSVLKNGHLRYMDEHFKLDGHANLTIMEAYAQDAILERVLNTGSLVWSKEWPKIAGNYWMYADWKNRGKHKDRQMMLAEVWIDSSGYANVCAGGHFRYESEYDALFAPFIIPTYPEEQFHDTFPAE